MPDMSWPIEMSASDHPVCGRCAILPEETWRDVPTGLRQWMNARKSVRTLAKGDYLFHQGAPCTALYRIVNGVMVLRKGDCEGNSIVVQLCRRHDLLGYCDYLEGAPHRISAQCVSDVLVCCLPIDVARQAFEQSPVLEQAFRTSLGNDLALAENRFLGLYGFSNREKLLIFIHEMAEAFGTVQDDCGTFIHIPLLRMDMAAIMGMARESISRTIKDIEQEGLIRFQQYGVLIPSWRAFQDVLNSIQSAKK